MAVQSLFWPYCFSIAMISGKQEWYAQQGKTFKACCGIMLICSQLSPKVSVTTVDNDLQGKTEILVKTM
jgi:hypothetical protein